MQQTMEKAKRHISEITAEYKPFWQPLFDNMGLRNPTFGAKLGYLGKEFSSDGKRVPCVRFFPNELSSGNDYYLELFDWDQNHYEAEYRVLFRLKYNENWKTDSRFVEVPSDKLPVPTYAIRLSDLEVVNRSSVKSLYPEMSGRPELSSTTFSSLLGADAEKQPDLFNEEELDEMYSEKEDDHYTKMTMRDLYCMLQNVPMSNKSWLNQLITKGNQWQQKK